MQHDARRIDAHLPNYSVVGVVDTWPCPSGLGLLRAENGGKGIQKKRYGWTLNFEWLRVNRCCRILISCGSTG